MSSYSGESVENEFVHLNQVLPLLKKGHTLEEAILAVVCYTPASNLHINHSVWIGKHENDNDSGFGFDVSYKYESELDVALPKIDLQITSIPVVARKRKLKTSGVQSE